MSAAGPRRAVLGCNTSVACVLLAALASFGCSPERDPPTYSPAAGKTIDIDKEASQEEGEQLSPDLAWSGYLPGSDELGTILLGDYHDPDGSKGVGAVLIAQVQTTCPACQKTASELAARLSGNWQTLGIEVIHLVVAGSESGLPSAKHALEWKNAYEASWAVGYDPNYTFLKQGSNALPIQVLIDPRTLEMVGRSEGYQSSYPNLEELASSNQ